MEGKVLLCVCIGIYYEYSWWYFVFCDVLVIVVVDEDDVDLVNFMYILLIFEICVVEGSVVKVICLVFYIFRSCFFLLLIFIFIDLKVKLFYIEVESF